VAELIADAESRPMKRIQAFFTSIRTVPPRMLHSLLCPRANCNNGCGVEDAIVVRCPTDAALDALSSHNEFTHRQIATLIFGRWMTNGRAGT